MLIAVVSACITGVVPREMTGAEIQEFLAYGTRTAKLATVSRSGAPHVMPVWFVLDGDQLVLTTGAETVKGRNVRRDPRVAVVVDDETPPFAFVHIRGRASVSEDLDELLRFATEIGGRYMGAQRAEEFGRRNAMPGELLVRITPERVISETDVAGY
jgi:PPOX class probable F420-dependent enzyme